LECVAAHFALGPHCESLLHWLQVPLAQISPAGHWEFAVQPIVVIMQFVPVHVRHAWYDWQKPPPDCVLEQYVPSLHAELDVQGPPKGGKKNGKEFVTEVHVWFDEHPVVEHCEQVPLEHVSHAGQSESDVHAALQYPVVVPGRRLHTAGELHWPAPVHWVAPLGTLASTGPPEPLLLPPIIGHGAPGGTHRQGPPRPQHSCPPPHIVIPDELVEDVMPLDDVRPLDDPNPLDPNPLDPMPLDPKPLDPKPLDDPANPLLPEEPATPLLLEPTNPLLLLLDTPMPLLLAEPKGLPLDAEENIASSPVAASPRSGARRGVLPPQPEPTAATPTEKPQATIPSASERRTAAVLIFCPLRSYPSTAANEHRSSPADFSGNGEGPGHRGPSARNV
jgi:hypothetical protein